jgi:hypothetical protein
VVRQEKTELTASAIYGATLYAGAITLTCGLPPWFSVTVWGIEGFFLDEEFASGYRVF